ncbi:MAG: 2-isopropylmalate synthase [Chloroflexi bacterium]|nr:2-isopropylmalate synthase [Chloroflexota bacterium]
MDDSNVDVRNTVLIFDTTLRDGEQSPGATLTSTEKLELAQQLARLGVDVIEAGFPAASPDDLRSVQRVAQVVGSTAAGETQYKVPIICGLARAVAGDIDAAWEAVKPAQRPRIHTFIATSDIHLEHKLKMTREQVIARTREMVARAKSYCDDVEFSPEDASRSDPRFLYAVLAAAIESGATTLNIPDTVGYSTPQEFGQLIAGIIANTKGIENAIVSVHCHNDLGMATANTMAGLQAGARQAEVTVNGIGERAGNTALEEVVMALYTRHPVYGLGTNIDTTQIAHTSRMVSHYTGLPVQPNKAIVGANAFAHEAGIHQDGLLKHHTTYEIMRPEIVGISQSQLVLGKHSGRHAFRSRLVEMGYEVEGEELDLAFQRFKELADKKKVVTDADLQALIADLFYRSEEIYQLVDLQVVAGRSGMPTATVMIKGPDNADQVHAAVGKGPIDATFRAIDGIVHTPNTLLEYNVHAITEGIDAQGEVTVRLLSEDNGGQVVGGYGADTDIIVASAKAYLGALNRLLVEKASKREEREASE